MLIDEERKYSLTKYSGRTGNKSIKESDHNTLIIEIDIKWKTKIDDPQERMAIYNSKAVETFSHYKFSLIKSSF